MTQYFVGLDVSLNQTSVCILDGAGRIISEAKVTTDPDTIGAYLERLGLEMERLGLEAGPLSQWLQAGLAARGLPAI